MKRWQDAWNVFVKNRSYLLLLCLTAVAGYGFKMMHPAIGIDDTPYAYYFEEGLVAIVGRWVLFVLNQVLHIGEYAPFLTDFAAILIFMLAVTVWGMLFYSVLGERIPRWGYFLFACLFLSNPLISEVFTYFLHNGISIGYLFSGISLCALRETRLRLGLAEEKVKKDKNGWKQALLPLLLTVVGLWVALGCYESFMIVWLLGLLLTLLSERIEGMPAKVVRSILLAAGVAVAALLLRSVMITLVIRFFGLGELRDEAVQRSITELLGWMQEPEALSEFAMVVKRLFVMYGVFGYAYYPIKIFVLAAVLLGLVALWRTICKRDAWILLLALGSGMVCFLLAVVEGKATLYRSAQFLPLFSAYGLLLIPYIGRKVYPALTKWCSATLRTRLIACAKGLILLVLGVTCFNQCSELNQWFYIDYQKYESAKETMGQVAYELEKHYDTTKPVIFTGTYEVPYSIIQKAYVQYNTETWIKMKRITDLVDPQLLEKYNRTYGVWVAQTPSLSVIEWGRNAFDDDSELIRFCAMHGHELIPLTDTTVYEEAELASINFPSFPQEGSIVDTGEYIIVHF